MHQMPNHIYTNRGLNRRYARRLSLSFSISTNRMFFVPFCDRVVNIDDGIVEFSWIMSNAFRSKGLKMSNRYFYFVFLVRRSVCCPSKIFKLFQANIAIP